MDFYFDYGSPYSYLAWHRIHKQPDRYAGTSIRWIPVSAGHIFAKDGTRPNAAYPNMLQYNTRDVLRWAKLYEVPLVVPESFPTNTIYASRLHLAAAGRGPAAEEAWMASAFHAHWQDGRDLAEAEVLRDLAKVVGVADAEGAVQDPAYKQQLIANTDQAYERGAPGVPYIILDDEPYWGNDRMDWVEARLKGQVAPPV